MLFKHSIKKEIKRWLKFNFNFNYNLNTNHIVKKINSIEYKIVRLLNNYIRLEYPSKNNKKYIRNYYLKNIEWENIKNNNDFSLNLKLTHEDTFGKSMKNHKIFSSVDTYYSYFI